MKQFRLIYLPEARNAVKKLPPAIKPSVKHGIERLINHPFDGKELVDELAASAPLPLANIVLST